VAETVRWTTEPRSVALAAALGLLLTVATVAVSAWRVSRVTIATAIRDLPEPPPARGAPVSWRARWWWLLLPAGGGLVALGLRAGWPRQSELLIDAAGLAILTIGIQAIVSFFIRSLSLFNQPTGPLLPGFWELVLLAAGCGLVAYGALDRAPGPAWLGVANLVVFILAAGTFSDETLYWWPLFLIVLGAGALAAGLRPRQPLPPEPDAYRAGDAPLASRSVDDEVIVRVRDDSPPDR
jgi:hypothetical protein